MALHADKTFALSGGLVETTASWLHFIASSKPDFQFKVYPPCACKTVSIDAPDFLGWLNRSAEDTPSSVYCEFSSLSVVATVLEAFTCKQRMEFNKFILGHVETS